MEKQQIERNRQENTMQTISEIVFGALQAWRWEITRICQGICVILVFLHIFFKIFVTFLIVKNYIILERKGKTPQTSS